MSSVPAVLQTRPQNEAASTLARQALPEADREQLAAAYAARALPAYPAAISATHLAAALDAACKLLPVGSMAPVLIAQRLAGRCRELLAQSGNFAAAMGSVLGSVPPPPGPAGPAQGSEHGGGPVAGGQMHDLGPGAAASQAAAAALPLAQLLAHLLLVVDFHVLPDSLAAAEAAALVAPPSLQQQVGPPRAFQLYHSPLVFTSNRGWDVICRAKPQQQVSPCVPHCTAGCLPSP